MKTDEMTLTQLIAEENMDILEDVIRIDAEGLAKNIIEIMIEEKTYEKLQELKNIKDRNTILKLQKHDFTNKQISDLLEISAEKVLDLTTHSG